MKTTWGALTTRHPVYVPMGRLGDLVKAIGPDAAARCTVTYGQAIGQDCKVALFASEGAQRTAVNMGARPLVRNATT